MSIQANNPVMTTMNILHTLVEVFITDAWFQTEVTTMMQEVSDVPSDVLLCCALYDYINILLCRSMLPSF